MLFVCLSVVTNRAGQGRVAKADTRPLDLLVARSNCLGGLLAVQTFSFCSPLPLTFLLPMSVCLSVVTNKAGQGRAGVG